MLKSVNHIKLFSMRESWEVRFGIDQHDNLKFIPKKIGRLLFR